MTDPVASAYELIAQARPLEALALVEPLGQRPDATHAQLAAYAEALKLTRREDEALAVYQRAIAAAPRSGVAEHNLAALQGDLGHHQPPKPPPAGPSPRASTRPRPGWCWAGRCRDSIATTRPRRPMARPCVGGRPWPRPIATSPS